MTLPTASRGEQCSHSCLGQPVNKALTENILVNEAGQEITFRSVKVGTQVAACEITLCSVKPGTKGTKERPRVLAALGYVRENAFRVCQSQLFTDLHRVGTISFEDQLSTDLEGLRPR